jgi:hypothetical protein
MAITEFQRSVCRLIARHRIESGVSYIAGAAALNTVIDAARISRDIDVFHDTPKAVEASWERDRQHLERSGYAVRAVREREGFVEAEVSGKTEAVLLQWTSDSAFRFFPLVEHEDFGLTLHPFDLATNKVLALVGRVEARDWIDTMECHRSVQRLGYLAWAACGKDPGFSPSLIVEQAARTARYSRAEIEALSFSSPPPDAAELSQRWHSMLDEALVLISMLPPERAGTAVMDLDGNLLNSDPIELSSAPESSSVHFHEGTLHGALPTIVREYDRGPGN